MVGRQHAGHVPPGQILIQCGHAADEARGFNGHERPRLLYQKHLVSQRVAGLIGVERHAAEIIDVHFALSQPDGGKVFLVHDVYLHGCVYLRRGVPRPCVCIIRHQKPFEKYAQFCGIVT